jgi:hypothetical protein
MILPVLADPGIPDERVGGLLRGQIGMGTLREAAATGWPALPRDHGRLSAMDTSYTYLRQFTPNVLAAIDFHGGPLTAELMQAVAMLAELNRTGGRKVPDSAPDGFVPTRYRDYLAKARRPVMKPRTGTTGSCACCWACVTGCTPGTCTCRGRAVTPTPGTYLFTPEQWAPRLAEFCALVGKPADGRHALEQVWRSCTSRWRSWRRCWPARLPTMWVRSGSIPRAAWSSRR